MKYLLILFALPILLSMAAPIDDDYDDDWKTIFTDVPISLERVVDCHGNVYYTGGNINEADIRIQQLIFQEKENKIGDAFSTILALLDDYCRDWEGIVEQIAANPDCKDPSNESKCNLSEAQKEMVSIFATVSKFLSKYVRNDWYDIAQFSHQDIEDLEHFVEDLEAQQKDPRVWEKLLSREIEDFKQNIAEVASKLSHKINKSNSKCPLFHKNRNGTCITCVQKRKECPDATTTTVKPIVNELPTADPTQNGEPGCRTCVDPNIANPAVCMQGTKCSVVRHDPADITTCHSLNTDTCTDGLIILNGHYEKFAPVQKTLCVDGKYTINNKVVKSIACANMFSPQEKPVNTDLTGTEPTTLTKFASWPADNCVALGNCSCVQASTKGLNQLAIVNNAGTEFLRVESLTFEFNTGDWIYEREVGDKIIPFKLDEGRTVRCVSPRVFSTTTVDPTQNGKPDRDSKCPLFHENHDGFCKWTEPDRSCGKLRHHNSNKEWVDVQRGYNSIPYQYNDKVDFAVVRNGCYMTIWAHPADIERVQHESNVILMKKLPMGEYNIPYSDVDKNLPGFDSRMNPSATSCNCTKLAFN